MPKTWTGVFAALLSLAACAPLPVGDTQNVSIESTPATPGMSVIYLLRSKMDMNYLGVPVYIDDHMLGTTHAGTYYRIEVPAGRHRFSGFAHDNGTITLDTQPNGVYFVQMRVPGMYVRVPSASSSYAIIDEASARVVMAGSDRREELPCGGMSCSAAVVVHPIIPEPKR